jgi:aldehyde dehydrogenase (NAD+)
MRILFGKFFNCGQTCIGVDHVYVHESVKEAFKKALLTTAEQFYGNGQNLP